MELLEIYQELKNEAVGSVRLAEPMSRHTTWRIGGPADVFVEPGGVDELRRTVVLARERSIPFLVIGNGSNLLVSDAGIHGLVIKICHGMSRVSVAGNTISAEAGARLSGLLQASREAGLGGFEFTAGIPGTVGGAIVMNAGANGSCMGNLVQSVTVMNFSGEVVCFEQGQLNFGYRTCALQDYPGIVVQANFTCQPKPKTEIQQTIEQYLSRRRLTQPLKYPNAGSVFKNPPGDSAGRLIELAGAKGMRFGGIQVSELHANFFVNNGNGTASEVLALVDTVRQMVSEKFGLTLALEVKIVGEQTGGGDSIAKVYDLRGQQSEGYG